MVSVSFGWDRLWLSYEAKGPICLLPQDSTQPLALPKRAMTEDQLADLPRLIAR